MDLILTADNPPPGAGVVTTIRAVDGMTIRVARWHPEASAAGTVVVCEGRAEFIEKYFEVAAELLKRNLAVVVFDWRGQGLSGRELDNSRKGHIDDFSIYERDLDALVVQVLEPFCPRPWFSLAHSMGAAVLITQARGGRSPFERLVACAPLIDLHGLRFPQASRFLAEALDIIGCGGAFIPGGRGDNALTLPFEDNRLTSDERRYRRNTAIVTAAPALAIGAPTIGWINAAFRQMAEFADAEYPRRTLTPILVFSAGGDTVVDPRSVERFATRLKAGSLIVLPFSRHEMLMERDSIRQLFWAGFDAFIPGTRDELEALETAQEWIMQARSGRPV